MGDKPTFNYSGYSRKEQRQFARKMLVVQRLGAQIDAHGADMPDDEFDKKMDELDRLTEDIERESMSRVVSVPRSWFAPGAPDGLTCKDDHWWDWLLADKIQELKDAALEAKHGRD